MKLLTMLRKNVYNDMSHKCHTSMFTTLLNCESHVQLPRKKNTLNLMTDFLSFLFSWLLERNF